jgi:5'-3' exonuclease
MVMTNMRIVLIDGANLAYRAQYTAGNLKTEKGKKTGVIYSFIKMLDSIYKKFGSCPVLVMWESGTLQVIKEGKDYKVKHEFIPLWRKTLPRQNYKANRNKITQDRIDVNKQIPEVQKVLTYLRYPQFSVPRLEGDDLIGIAACQLSQQSVVDEVCIVSSDKDFFQCINSTVNVYRPGKGSFDKYDAARVLKEYGVPANWFAEYKSLIGDGGDFYKGIKGVGPAAAKKLFFLGADPRRSWGHQPSEVIVAFPKLQDVWFRAVDDYKLALIPRHWDHKYWDSDLRDITKKAFRHFEDKLYRTFSRDELEASLQLFVKFCARYELLSLIADKRKFFEGVLIKEH